MVREIFVNVDGRRTRCLDAGSGWPVLLIHAFPCSADMWRPQLERVPDGYRYIAPDLRGFGPRSANAPLETSVRPSMDEYARDMGRVLDALHIDTAVIGGLSMGGYVTFALHRQDPERFSGMLLADTRPQADTPDGRAARENMRNLLVDRGPSGIAEQLIPKLVPVSARDGNARVVDETRRMIEGTDPAAIDASLIALMERPDSTSDLPQIACPVLILVGQLDEVTPPSDAERMHHRIKRSMLTVIRGAGHLSNLERPDEFAHALHDFLVAHM
jgi:3-oxoadipate enol-lactonase